MADRINVSSELSTIENAIYGEEVRSSIYNGIKKVAAGTNGIGNEWDSAIASGKFNATIEIGNVATGAPGTQVQIKNSGTNAHAKLDFTIPKGDTGSVDNVTAPQVKTTDGSDVQTKLDTIFNTMWIKATNIGSRIITGTKIALNTIATDNLADGSVTPAKTKVQYSTAEQKTGEIWTNGKPVYRRSFNITTVNRKYTLVMANYGMELVWPHPKSYLLSGTFQYAIPKPSLEGGNNQIEFLPNSGSVLVQCGSAYATSLSGVLVLEYTKTTD